MILLCDAAERDDEHTEQEISDIFTSACSIDIELGYQIVSLLHEHPLSRHLYKMLVSFGDETAVNRVYEATAEKHTDAEHLAKINSTGGRTWLKRLRSDVKNGRLKIGKNLMEFIIGTRK